MEPVDGGEILGQAIGRAMMIGPCLGNAGRGMGVDDPDPSLVSQSLAGGPFQLLLSPTSIALVARIAGVHSTVWILAISAETMSRAVL